jgi:phosphoadenosine phosphosulfate reductase
MIIETERHSKKDLEIWNELYEIDLNYYEDNKERFKYKEEKAIQEIIKFKNNTDCYCGVSWGKDSVVVSHLVYRSKVNIPLLNLKCIPNQNIYCLKVRDLFLEKFNMQYEEIIVDYQDIYRLNLPEHIQDKETDKLFYKGFKQASEKFGNGHLSGVREKESNVRRLSALKHGIATEKSCRPILYWTNQEVFSYLAYYDLPTHPNYAMLMNGLKKRDSIRTAELGDISGRGMGRLEWETRYYGDYIRRNQK